MSDLESFDSGILNFLMFYVESNLESISIIDLQRCFFVSFSLMDSLMMVFHHLAFHPLTSTWMKPLCREFFL